MGFNSEFKGLKTELMQGCDILVLYLYHVLVRCWNLDTLENRSGYLKSFGCGSGKGWR